MDRSPVPGGVLGAILAGGEGRRFGGPKALASLGGIPLLERAFRVLEPVTAAVVVVGRPPGVTLPVSLPVVPDRRPGRGPAGGVEAALSHARDQGLVGALILACDLPLVPPGLVARLLEEGDSVGPVVPLSSGPLGCEPLCAYYGVDLLAEVTAFLDGGGASMGALLDRLPPGRRVGPREGGRSLPGQAEPWPGVPGGDPFLNVNRPIEARRAEALLGRHR